MSDLNPDARRLVDLARKARTPGAEAKLRMAERLAVPLAASAAAGGLVSAAKAAAGTSAVAGAGAKVAGTPLLGGLGVKLAALFAIGAVGTAVVVGQGSSKRASVTPPPPVAAAQRASEPVAPPAEPAPQAAVPAEPATPVDALPELEKPGTPSPIVHSAKPADDLAHEAELLHQAQSAWRAGQSARALSLANQHAQRFPRSQLANERDVLRVLSLCKLGQVQSAKQVGARLLRTAKGSPWYQSVADSCAGN